MTAVAAACRTPSPTPAAGGARADLRRVLHDRARRVDRGRRAAVDRRSRCTSRLRDLQWVIDGLRDHVRRAPAARRATADMLGRRRLFMSGARRSSPLASLVCGLAQSRDMLDRGAARPGRSARRSSRRRRSRSSRRRSRKAPSATRRSASGARGRRAARPRACSSAACSRSTLGWQWIFFVNVPVGAARPASDPARSSRESKGAGRAPRVRRSPARLRCTVGLRAARARDLARAARGLELVPSTIVLARGRGRAASSRSFLIERPALATPLEPLKHLPGLDRHRRERRRRCCSAPSSSRTSSC